MYVLLFYYVMLIFVFIGVDVVCNLVGFINLCGFVLID